MTRADIYLQILSEKTGQPPESLQLALESLKKRLNDDLSEHIEPLQAEHLANRLRRTPPGELFGRAIVERRRLRDLRQP